MFFNIMLAYIHVYNNIYPIYGIHICGQVVNSPESIHLLTHTVNIAEFSASVTIIANQVLT